MKSDYKERIEAKSDAAGTFEVDVEGSGHIEQRDLYLRDMGIGFEIGIADDPPGHMPPTRFLFLEFPDKPVFKQYDVRQLKRVTYHDYSEWHSYEFIAESGTVTLAYQDSPRRTLGRVDIAGRLIGNPIPIPGPEIVKITGWFYLKAI